ncbi:MAG TPA: AAA family ATPase [Thermodesulfovibrionales bacterium]|jgi:type II secretory pathway predicted ATPase ExeA|nr:AAA family ATPase [Thermodesulfovibrionales bacterium]
MYEDFYGFTAKPFAKTPDPKFLFLSKVHEEALARLHYAVEEKEITVLTGEIGCGKTTLTRALMDSLDERYRVVLIINPRLTSIELIKTICSRFECDSRSPYKNDLIDNLYARFYDDYQSRITPVIIIDEAHLIPYRETFEEIRLLTNFQMDDTNLISLILVGQPELKRKLDSEALAALRQRVGLFYHLGMIRADEVRGYVEHRMKAGGRDGPLFTDSALTSLYIYSRGIPRIINSLATMALLEGFAQDAPMIDDGIILSAAKEIGLNGYRKDQEEE